MTNMLSNWAREFLREDHVAVVSTLNKDGSSHLAAIWYVLADDGSLVMTTPGRSQKGKNLRRDPRIALCVGDAGRSLSLYARLCTKSEKWGHEASDEVRYKLTKAYLSQGDMSCHYPQPL